MIMYSLCPILWPLSITWTFRQRKNFKSKIMWYLGDPCGNNVCSYGFPEVRGQGQQRNSLYGLSVLIKDPSAGWVPADTAA